MNKNDLITQFIFFNGIKKEKDYKYDNYSIITYNIVNFLVNGK